jgi:hypothetical protein
VSVARPSPEETPEPQRGIPVAGEEQQPQGAVPAIPPPRSGAGGARSPRGAARHGLGLHTPTLLRARRREATLRRRRVRLDVLAGLVLAAILVLASPGLAIVTVVAVLLLLVCLASIPAERLFRRRRRR